MTLKEIDLPNVPREWEKQVMKETQEDPASLNISDIGGSASTICYRDWLLLKVLWDVNNTDLTHGTIFGQKAGAHQERFSRQCLTEGSGWWQAFVSQQKEPSEWSTMFGWKQSANDIRQCEGAFRLCVGLSYRSGLAQTSGS